MLGNLRTWDHTELTKLSQTHVNPCDSTYSPVTKHCRGPNKHGVIAVCCCCFSRCPHLCRYSKETGEMVTDVKWFLESIVQALNCALYSWYAARYGHFFKFAICPLSTAYSLSVVFIQIVPLIRTSQLFSLTNAKQKSTRESLGWEWTKETTKRCMGLDSRGSWRRLALPRWQDCRLWVAA